MKHWPIVAVLIVGFSALPGCQQSLLTRAIYLDVPASQPAGPELIPDQTVLLLDDLRVTNAVIKGQNLQAAGTYWARLYAKGKKEKNDPEVIGIVAESIEVGDNGTTIIAHFPSMVAWDFVPQKLQLFSNNAQDPIHVFDIDNLVYRTRQPEPPPGPKQTFALSITSTTIVADATGHGVLKIGFAKLEDDARLQLSIEGAQIEGDLEDPANMLQHDPIQWFVTGTGTATFSLGNLSEYSDVIITGRDAKGVTYGPVRLRVLRAAK